MAKLVITGTVKIVGELFQAENSDFKKKSLIVKEEGEYGQTLEIEFVKDKEELLDIISVGQTVDVSVNVRGREWTSPSGEIKYFTSFAGWKVVVK